MAPQSLHRICQRVAKSLGKLLQNSIKWKGSKTFNSGTGEEEMDQTSIISMSMHKIARNNMRGRNPAALNDQKLAKIQQQ